MTAVFFSSDPDDDFLLSFLTCTHTHTVNYYNNHYRVLTLTTVVAVIIPASASIEGSDLWRPDSSLFGLPRFFFNSPTLMNCVDVFPFVSRWPMFRFSTCFWVAECQVFTFEKFTAA